MYDCPNCRTPLHGHEETCPACGARQYVKRGFRNIQDVQQAPAVNWMPFVILFLVVGAGIMVAANSTWIGHLMKEGPRQEDPLEKLTYTDARNIIEQKITEGLTAVGAKGKFTWKNPDESPADKNSPQNVNLDIETKLKDPTSRKAILDPIKPYMDKAKIPTLTMTDTKSHATWTYTVQVSSTPSTDQEPSSYEALKQEEEKEEHKPAPSFGSEPLQSQQPAQQQPAQQQPAQQQPAQQQPAQQEPAQQQPAQQQPAQQQPAQQQPVQQQPAQQRPAQKQEQMPWDQQQGSQ